MTVLFLFLEMACVAVAYTPGDVLLKKQMNGYMNDIKWGQSKNNETPDFNDLFVGCSPSYNAHCPSSIGEVDQCQKTLAGCGAIAIGQIMAMWQFPAKSKYRTYNWNNIPPVLRDDDPEDCPLLIKDIGQACNMHYQTFAGFDITGSWCTSRNIVDALETFSYHVNSCDKEEWLKYNTLENWYDLIRNEIDCGRPVIMFGKKGSITDSHYFVIDGYSQYDPNKFHINWGWKGNKNDFFYLNDCDYINDQKIFYGIYPKVENAPKISYTKKRNYIVNYCEASEIGSVQYWVENVDSWECTVTDRQGKIIWIGGGGVKNGEASVWDGSASIALGQTDYWLYITFKNSKGGYENFQTHVTYLIDGSYYRKDIISDLLNSEYSPNCQDGSNDVIEIKTDNARRYSAILYDYDNIPIWSKSDNVDIKNRMIKMSPYMGDHESGYYTLKLQMEGGCNCNSSATSSFSIYYNSSKCGELSESSNISSENIIKISKQSDLLEISSLEPLTKISVYSISGTCIVQGNCSGYIHNIDISKIQKNLLIVVVQTENGVYSKKILIE